MSLKKKTIRNCHSGNGKIPVQKTEPDPGRMELSGKESLHDLPWSLICKVTILQHAGVFIFSIHRSCGKPCGNDQFPNDKRPAKLGLRALCTDYGQGGAC
jgi:hypothetical protein